MPMPQLTANRLVAEVLIDLARQQIEAALFDFGENFAALERADVTALVYALQIALEQADQAEIQLIQQGLQSAIANFREQIGQRLRQEQAPWHDIWDLGRD